MNKKLLTIGLVLFTLCVLFAGSAFAYIHDHAQTTMGGKIQDVSPKRLVPETNTPGTVESTTTNTPVVDTPVLESTRTSVPIDNTPTTEPSPTEKVEPTSTPSTGYPPPVDETPAYPAP